LRFAAQQVFRPLVGQLFEEAPGFDRAGAFECFKGPELAQAGSGGEGIGEGWPKAATLFGPKNACGTRLPTANEQAK